MERKLGVPYCDRIWWAIVMLCSKTKMGLGYVMDSVEKA